ncbi:13579_t:CDS:2, partial [Dentiscutata heterogama]
MADFDLNAIYKIKPFFDNKSFSGTWAPLDHSDSVEKVLEELKKGKIPVVTAKTGARKSTDFVQNISAHFNCTMLSMPRVSLVKNHASSAPKLFANTCDNMDENNLNVCIHGWLQVTNHSFKDKDFLIIIDEFHEMDEDSLILLERYKDNIILLSTTPIPIPNSTTITLSKSRSPYTITKLLSPPNIHLEIHNTIASSLSRKIQVVDAKNDEIKDDTEIIIVNGKFVTRESSHAIEIQRAGKTGRTNDGLYVRLNNKYNDTPFDPKIPLNPKIPSCYNALLSNPDIGIYLEILFGSQQSDADMLYRLLLGGHFNQNTYHFAKSLPTTPLEDIWIALNNYKINTRPFQQNM